MGNQYEVLRTCQQIEEALAQRVKLLMAPGAEFDPLQGANLAAALAGGNDADENFTAIGHLIHNGKAEEAIQMMRNISTSYWQLRAWRRASMDMGAEAAMPPAADSEKIASAAPAEQPYNNFSRLVEGIVDRLRTTPAAWFPSKAMKGGV